MIEEVIMIVLSSSLVGYLMYYQRGLEGVKQEFNIELPVLIKLMVLENVVFAWILVFTVLLLIILKKVL